MNEISVFFEYLSYRKKNENDLSDVTWALCETSFDFKSAFLTFIFGENQDWSKLTEFTREYSRANSRVDFYFKIEKQEYIIEVKIYDKQQHLEDYIRDFPEAKRGYITNYYLSEKKKCESEYFIKTWEEFSSHLRNNLSHNSEFIKGYLKYLDNICAIKNIKQMQLSGIQSLYSFINTLDKVIEGDYENYSYSRYTQTSKSWDIRQGRCFYLNFKNEEINDVWAWIGLYYNEQTVVCIEFDSNEGWGKPVYDILKNKEEHEKGRYRSLAYEEDGAFYFNLLNVDEFDNKEKEEQIEILKTFFNETIDYIVSLALN